MRKGVRLNARSIGQVTITLGGTTTRYQFIDGVNSSGTDILCPDHQNRKMVDKWPRVFWNYNNNNLYPRRVRWIGFRDVFRKPYYGTGLTVK